MLRSHDHFFIGRVVSLCLLAAAVQLAVGMPALAAEGDEFPQAMIVVIGAAGAGEFEGQFQQWAQAWEQLAAAHSWPVQVIHQATADDLSPREQLQRAIAGEQVANSQRLWMILLGHGTYAKGAAKFNLTGPDFSATEMRQWLQPLEAEIVVVNCSSASAPFLTELSAQRRVVLTATRSGTEINFSRFGEYLSQSITDLSADLDHDESVSLLEAFLAANAQTQRYYTENARLATEHALLEDNGDRAGTPADFYSGLQAAKSAKDGKPADGALAARIILFSSPTALQFTPAQTQQRDQIEQQIRDLQMRKANLQTEDYFAQLEKLLLQLSLLYETASNQPSLSE